MVEFLELGEGEEKRRERERAKQLNGCEREGGRDEGLRLIIYVYLGSDWKHAWEIFELRRTICERPGWSGL